ncbi:hypothetical protein PHLGIDRAFT_130057 [Phlebiopsis gigantea 11061_1 CR5-6]|uniref:Opi1-domain-containing protein n=1 Tax=Phlebiopsis gigantea (strain 11061_1 CR5-6) TaxID=745531 RepID=A0A0C3S5J1_PHLG1|nr:hypothetical protein PHLGIDRAFT_130057 [Phlebiopsis gigantea 11061_1 CR5-6]
MDSVREHPALEDQEESVRIAVRALGDMRNSAVHASPTTTSKEAFQPTPALSHTSRSSSPSLPDDDSTDFVSRVSTIPLVNSALNFYEQGKASSRVVKYGAEMMESSMKTISRPVIDRLPVNQLDEFACRQLDKLDTYRRRQSPERGTAQDAMSDRTWTSALRDMPSIVRGRRREGSADAQRDRDVSMSRSDDFDIKMTSIPESHSRTPTPRQDENAAQAGDQQQVMQRSRWQAVLLEAGGIGAAISEESMRRLKYCLQWLQYATSHIDAQILVLRELIASLQNNPSSSTALTPLAEQHLQTLTTIRRDVVDTIRQVVDVVSKYAGGALPEPARTRVRTFILCLPQRWAHAAAGPLVPNANGVTHANGADNKKDIGVGSGRGRGRTGAAPYTYGPGEAGPSPRSRPASRATSPSSLRTHPHPHPHTHGRQASGGVPAAGATQQAAQKILTLATESLDMLRSVTAVFKESLDKADAWVERLRVVGIQRQSSTTTSPTPPPTLPPPSSLSLTQNHSLDVYRDPLPPIQSTPSSSRAHSPVPSFAQLQLPPLDPALIAASGYANRQQQMRGQRRDSYGRLVPDPSKDFDALTLSSGSASAASSLPPSRFSTPRITTMGLPPDGDGDGLAMPREDDVRKPVSNGRDPTAEDGTRRMDVDA